MGGFGSGPQLPGGPWAWGAEAVRRQHRSSWGGPRGDNEWSFPHSGPPPWLASVLGLMQGETPRAPRVRRGDVRTAILSVLATEPMNGYQVIAQITERSGGAWRPSPGSVYPTIAQLEDEGLVEGDAETGRRTLRLTLAGERYIAENPEQIDGVWNAFGSTHAQNARPDYAALKPELGQLVNAIWQIATVGSDRQRAEAIALVSETRRKLYALLAEGSEPGSASGTRPSSTGSSARAWPTDSVDADEAIEEEER